MDMLPTAMGVAARVTLRKLGYFGNTDGISFGAEPQTDCFENQSLYFGYRCDQRPFLYQSCIGKAQKISIS